MCAVGSYLFAIVQILGIGAQCLVFSPLVNSIEVLDYVLHCLL